MAITQKCAGIPAEHTGGASYRQRLRIKPLHATTLFAVLAGMPMLLMPTAAYAQEVPATTPVPAADPAGQETAAVEETPEAGTEITVTGTRISGFTAPTPVTTLGQDELETKAISTVSELLDDVPQLRINQNIGKSSEPVGASNADLRGLGTQRTLVLIDGRRVAITDPAGTIDTNIVPVALISSVEIVTGGASAAYGSDAVAGVVNFKLDKKLKGLKLDVAYGQTTYNDYHRPTVSAAYGTGLLDDRLHLAVAGDYLRNSGQTSQAARPWGDDQTALLTNPAYTATNGQPRLIISDNARFVQSTGGGVLARANGLAIAQRLGFPTGTGVQFDRNGNPVPFTYGTNIGGVYMTGGDGGTVQDAGNLQPLIERFTGYGSVTFDVSDNITFFADALYSRVNVLSDLSEKIDNGNITIRNDNAFLPSSVRAAMAAAALSSISIGRIDYEGGESIYDNSTVARRYTFGVEGRLGAGWTWDVSGQIGRNSYESLAINNRLVQRFTNAADAVINPATGQPVCRIRLTTPNPTDAQDPYRDNRDCVPVNLFGNGSISQGALSYYRVDSFTRSRQEQDVFAANMSGSPFATWAGDVKVAFGAEYRRESTVQTADADSAGRRLQSINSQPFDAEYTVKEGYAEVVVPLAQGSRFADSLDVNGAIRYTDYSLSGGVVTWKLGVNYAPYSDLRFRATLSRDIRAPNNFELFSRGNQVVNSIIDPRVNIGRQTLQLTSGNPTLTPEKADTFTGGVIFQPSFLQGFRASIDYYRISIQQAITTVPAQSIVNFCEEGRTEFCSGVIRDPVTQQITQVNVIPFNADSIKTSGVDVELQYRFPVLGGDLKLRGLANYVAEISTTSNGVTNDYVGLAGIGAPPQGLPEWRINLDADYSVDGFKFGVGYRYIDGGKFDTRFNITTLDLIDNNVSGRSYVDLSASYKVTSAVELYGRVENLFDVDPPITPNTLLQPTVANTTFFDRRGTFFVVGARLRL